MEKKVSRLRRARRSRTRIGDQGVPRLCVFRTPRHIYAQIIVAGGSQTAVSASTVEPGVKKEVGYGGNIAAATVVGRLIAERAREKGFDKVAFDRSGFKYHGRVKALADSARENGLKF